MKMMDQGKSLKEMRAQIEKTYAKYGPPTPTPRHHKSFQRSNGKFHLSDNEVLKNGFHISRINGDLTLGGQQSTPSANLFGAYPETMEERFGHWTELWDVLDWLECVLRPEI